MSFKGQYQITQAIKQIEQKRVPQKRPFLKKGSRKFLACSNKRISDEAEQKRQDSIVRQYKKSEQKVNTEVSKQLIAKGRNSKKINSKNVIHKNLLKNVSKCNEQYYSNETQCQFPKLKKQEYIFLPLKMYASLRNAALKYCMKTNLCQIKVFDDGRQQHKYANFQQMTLQNVKLVSWKNGDFKVIQNQKVFYWNESLKTLDQFAIAEAQK